VVREGGSQANPTLPLIPWVGLGIDPGNSGPVHHADAFHSALRGCFSTCTVPDAARSRRSENQCLAGACEDPPSSSSYCQEQSVFSGPSTMCGKNPPYLQ